MTKETKKSWLQNITALLLDRLSKRAAELKISEKNEYFRKIEKAITNLVIEFQRKIDHDIKVRNSDFVREIKSMITGLSHIVIWDRLVGF